MKASFAITYDKDLNPYTYHKVFRKEEERPHSLSRWVSSAIYNFRLEYQRIDLASLFGDMEIIVLGFPGYGAEEEADLVFNGLLNLQKTKAKIYKFRHIGEHPVLYRALSYAVLIAIKNSSRRFWVVFPEACGLDSGGAYQSYLDFEQLISRLQKKVGVDIRKVDIPYEKLESFLFKRATSFHSLKEGIECINPEVNFPSCPRILENSENQFSILCTCFDNNEFGQALRDLRALIQQAEENILRLKFPEDEIPNNTTIKTLTGILIGKKLLPGRILPWIDAFLSVANQSSHKDFPSSTEMENSNVRKRVMLTFETGFQILEELDGVLYPKISNFQEPKIYIKKERI
jgi:hypothetical protein